MNKVKMISKKLDANRDGMDLVRAANAAIRRVNKDRRLRHEMQEKMRPYTPAIGKTISTNYTRESLAAMKKPDLVDIARIYKIKGISKLKKEWLIGEILAAQDSMEVVE